MSGLVMLVAAMVVVITVAVVMIVGAALRIERRVDGRKPRAEATQHVFDHMVAADAQPLARDLHVDVTIADMPGEARQIVGAGRGDFDERLRAADHTDDCPVVQHEAVAVAERGGLRKVEQKFGAVLAVQHHAAAMALMGIELNRVDGFCLIPMSGGFDVARVLHG